MPISTHNHTDAGTILAPTRAGSQGSVRTESARGVIFHACAALGLCFCLPAFAVDVDTQDTQPATAGGQFDADNTGRNTRDREDATLTPMDQSNDAHDIAVTTAIRKALVADKSLGVDAQNIKIITVGGHVTLRGPVHSSAERTRIADLSAQSAGAANITNQIELIAP